MKSAGYNSQELAKCESGGILAQRYSTKESVERQIESLKDDLGKAERLSILLTEHPEIAEALDLLKQLGSRLF